MASNKSQRDGNFNGGIKDGSKAATPESTGLDFAPRQYFQTHDYGNRWIVGYDGEELKKRLGRKSDSRVAGIFPDGGILLDSDGNPCVIFESKKQGKNGNAIERWYKNAAIAKALGVRRYVTFCLGEGFYDGNSAERILNDALLVWDPEKETLWGDDDSTFAFYRFSSLEDAVSTLPSIMDDNIERFLA